MSDWPAMNWRGPMVSEAQVRAFEEAIHAPLPADYRRFLLEVNGGYVAASHSVFPFGTSESILNSFYSLCDEQDRGNLEVRWRFNRGRLPDEAFVIGYDDGGSDICLVFRGDHVGEVWFLDHINARSDEANPRAEWWRRRDFIKLADSFTEFVATLSPDDIE